LSPHATPTPVGALSMAPLQSSSMPLQVSCVDETDCVQVRPFGPEPGVAAHR
jgi:hypothetical protein